jgi:hypothetical protein
VQGKQAVQKMCKQKDAHQSVQKVCKGFGQMLRGTVRGGGIRILLLYPVRWLITEPLHLLIRGLFHNKATDKSLKLAFGIRLMIEARKPPPLFLLTPSLLPVKPNRLRRNFEIAINGNTSG